VTGHAPALGPLPRHPAATRRQTASAVDSTSYGVSFSLPAVGLLLLLFLPRDVYLSFFECEYK